MFVFHGEREPDERLFVCARGEGPLELPARGGRGRGAHPFEPSECRRTRPAAAVSPRRSPSWSEKRIGEALADFLGRDSHDTWPQDDLFLAAGEGRLLEQLWRSGGPQRWAPEMGLRPDRGRHTRARWTERRALGTLEVFLRGREKWPTRTEFAAAGYEGLHDWLRRRGGAKRWSREYGLPIAWGTPRRWTDEAIDATLRELIGEGGLYPRYVDFTRAGMGGLCATVREGRGHDWWARQLGVPRPRRGPARPAPRIGGEPD